MNNGFLWPRRSRLGKRSAYAGSSPFRGFKRKPPEGGSIPFRLYLPGV